MAQPFDGLAVAFGIVGGLIGLLAGFLALFAAVPGMPVKAVVRQLQFIAIFTTFPCIPRDFREFAEGFSWALGRFDFVDVDGGGDSPRFSVPDSIKDNEFFNGLIFMVLISFLLLLLFAAVHAIRAGTWTRTMLESLRMGFPHYGLALGLFLFLPMTQAAVDLVSTRTGDANLPRGINDLKEIIAWKAVGIAFFCLVSVPWLVWTTALVFTHGPRTRLTKYRPWPLHQRDQKTLGFIKRYNVPEGEWVNSEIYADYTNRYGSLFETYKPQYYWWGALLYWKIFILAIVTGVGASNQESCKGLLTFLLLVYSAYFFAFWCCRPHLGENFIQGFVHLMEVLVLLIVLLFQIDDVRDNEDGIAAGMIALVNIAIILLAIKLLISFVSGFLAKRRRKMRREFARERGQQDPEVEEMKKKFNPWAPYGFEPKIGFLDKKLQIVERVNPEPPGIDVFGKAMDPSEIGQPTKGMRHMTKLTDSIDTGFLPTSRRGPGFYEGGRRSGMGSWE